MSEEKLIVEFTNGGIIYRGLQSLSDEHVEDVWLRLTKERDRRQKKKAG